MKNEIVLYKSDELASRIEARIEEDTVWLNRQQTATLFGRDVNTIGKQINNNFSEAELVKEVVVANFATTATNGKIYQTEHYELQELLGYTDWRNFLKAVDKAKESCKTSGEAGSDHFVDVNKTIPMPKGASKVMPYIMRTGYACHNKMPVEN